ncbi:hypothetical protein GCM10010195_06520 [Kitasatospora griseola]|nr:hypothetical protein GCM10010195_06520 [Kitasatospora griseola]
MPWAASRSMCWRTGGVSDALTGVSCGEVWGAARGAGVRLLAALGCTDRETPEFAALGGGGAAASGLRGRRRNRSLLVANRRDAGHRPARGPTQKFIHPYSY